MSEGYLPKTIKPCYVCGKETKNKVICLNGNVFRLCILHELEVKRFIINLKEGSVKE